MVLYKQDVKQKDVKQRQKTKGPDFLLHCTTHYIIIECDESYHSQYACDCEIKREYDICVGLGIPCIFIRYNPDTYYENEKATRKTQKYRHELLVNTINKYIHIPEDFFSTSFIFKHYLFYPGDNEEKTEYLII